MSANPSYFHEDDVVGKFYDARLMRRMLEFIRPYWLLATLAVLLVIMGMGLFIVNPYILGRVVDEGIKPGNLQAISRFAVIYLMIEILVFLFGYVQQYLLVYVGQKVMFDLRSRVFGHLQKMPIPFFDHNPVGRLVTRTTNDVASLAELFSAGLVVVIGDVFLIIGISVALVLLQPTLGMATLTVIPVLILAAMYFQRRFREVYRAVRSRIARVNSALSENISGMKIIKIFHCEEERSAKFEALNSDHRDAQLSSIFYHSLLAPLVTVVNAIAIVIILLLGGRMIEQGTLTIGVLVSFIAYAHNFFHPIRDITEKIGIFQSAMASAERVFGLLDQPEDVPLTAGETPATLNGEIVFDRVNFAYEPGKPVLQDISFEIAAGESVALVGHTGAGKTTITALLNRFYEIDGGRILIDGRDISGLSKAFLRRNIVVIQQEVFIFSGNVRENIRLWSPDISPETVAAAARETNAETFITAMAGGYQAELNERGSNLSAGQRQLLAFARALCADPRILILDEATSSVDTETERAIQAAIARLTKGRTSLIVAHRLSTIQSCDRVLVFHQGRLVESGKHDQLLAQKGYYYRLHQLQFRESTLNGTGTSA